MTSVRVIAGTAFGAFVGAWLYRVNQHTDDTGILAGLILIGSAMATLILPRRWWPLAMIVGGCVIASEFYRSGSQMNGHVTGVAAFIVVLSFAGVGAATALRLLVQPGNKPA